MTDVIVIGSGGAGLSCALESANRGLDVIVISKTYPTMSQTAQAQGGINAIFEKEDIHIKETFEAGKKIADIKAIEKLVKNSKDTIHWLESIGVSFNKDKDGNFLTKRLGGVSIDRAVFCDDYTGLKILQSLYQNCIGKVKFLNEYLLLDLIIDEEAKGVVVLDIKNNAIIELFAKNIVLASGGYAGIFLNNTTNSTQNKGEVISIAIENNVEIKDLSYIQFHPTAIKNKNILLSEALRGLGAKIVNKDKQRFVDELAPRDIVTKAIYQELKKGEVYLDISDIPNEKLQEIPQDLENIKFYGYDKLIPIEPASHYSMGGIKTKNTKTNINKLFAIGEVANENIHGKNRLGGNSLLEIVTFGRDVVNYFDLNNNQTNLSKLKKSQNFLNSFFEKEGKENFYQIKQEFAKAIFNYDINTIEKLEIKFQNAPLLDRSTKFNLHIIEQIEMYHMLKLAKIIIKDKQEKISN